MDTMQQAMGQPASMTHCLICQQKNHVMLLVCLPISLAAPRSAARCGQNAIPAIAKVAAANNTPFKFHCNTFK